MGGTLGSGVRPDQKERVMGELRSEADVKRRRQENKLEKMRWNRRVEQENHRAKE